jgi:hypothetical protein
MSAMKRWQIFSAALVFVCIGCAPSIKIMTEFHDDAFSFGKMNGKKIKVFVADNVNLMEFKNAFQKEYQSDKQFAATIRSQIVDTARSIVGVAASAADSMQDIKPLLSTSFDSAAISRVQAMFNASGEDFFLIVKAVDISNKMSQNAPVYTGQPGAGGMYMGGGSSESCIVTMHTEIWSVKEKKKVLSFSSMGDSKVVMLFFGTALKNAVKDAIVHMLNYVVTGAIE